MEFRQIVTYLGPNRWSGVATFEVQIDWGTRSRWKSSADPESSRRLLSFLPALDDPPQTVSAAIPMAAQQESFSNAARRGLSLGEVLERVLCVLLSAAGTPAGFHRCVVNESSTTCTLAFEIEEEPLGRACLETARQCVTAALDDQPFNAPVAIRKLVDLADNVRLGPSTRAILRAAAERGIPFRRLAGSNLVQLGEGAKQHRIWTAETDETSSIGEDIAQDKELTKRLLRAVGVPVPDGRVAETADETWSAAREIGLPVVIKPRDANHGRGVSFDLSTRDEILEAFELARRENKDGTTGVIIEQYARGQAHRLLVVGDRLIAAVRGQKDIVTGDGRRTVEQLVEEANRDPLRGENYTDLLGMLKLDDVAKLLLKQQQLTDQSVPAEGQAVVVKINGDLTTDETSEVHPAVAERVVLAAQTVGLNIAGLDVIAEDIGRPLEEQGGMIIEVNAGPGLLMHVNPLYGRPQPVGAAIVELMFPSGANGRIPIIGIAADSAANQIAQSVGQMLRQLEWRIGIATGEQVQVDGQRACFMPGLDRDRIRSLLLQPRVEAAIFESHAAESLQFGLGCERVDVAVLAGFAGSAARLDDVLPLIHAVPKTGSLIVSADAPELDRVLAECCGQVVLCSASGELPILRAHQASGGRVAFILKGSLAVGDGLNAYLLSIKSTNISELKQREAILLAVAAAWSAGVPVELLRDLLGKGGLNGDH